MTPREVDLIRVRLVDISDTALALARHAEDLYRLAYEKGSPATDVKVAGGGAPGGLDAVGDMRARHLWRTLERRARSSEVALRAVLQGMGNLFAQGQVDDRIRFGSALTPGEFDRLLAKQTARGDSPARIEEQPDHPGRKKQKGRRR